MSINKNDYDQFVDDLISIAVNELNDKGLISDVVNFVVYNFIKAGYEYGLSSEEIIDFFGVSSDSVVYRLVNCNDDERDFLLHAFDRHNEYLFKLYNRNSAQQGDAPEPATNADPASPKFQPPAR